MYEAKFKFFNNESFIFDRMVEHAFLCRKPLDTKAELEQTEIGLLAMMDDAVNNIDERIIPSRVRLLFDNMHALYRQDEFKPEMISNQIRHGIMSPHDMIGIYVRSANCGLFLSQTQTGTVTMATFQANLSNKDIYGVRKNRNGDIQVIIHCIVFHPSVLMQDTVTFERYLLSCDMHRSNITLSCITTLDSSIQKLFLVSPIPGGLSDASR